MPKKILIVETHQELGDVYVDLLEQMGHHAICCSTEQRFFEILKNQSVFDLILVDINEDVRPSLKILESCIKSKAAPAIFAMTASFNQEVKDLARLSGAHRILQKPFDILETIHQLDN